MINKSQKLNINKQRAKIENQGKISKAWAQRIKHMWIAAMTAVFVKRLQFCP